MDDDVPDFLVIAGQLADEPLDFRFSAVKLTIAMFLEAFATKWLVRLLSHGEYPHLRPIPSEKSDVEDRIRYHFDPRLANSVFDARPSSSPAWLKIHTPDHVVWQDFGTFLILCDTAIARWKMRRTHERHVIIGAWLFARIAAFTIQCLFALAIYLRGFQTSMMIIMIVAVVLAAVACKNKLSIT